MWVYQETKTEADALVPRLPERAPLPMKEAEQTSHTPEPSQKEIPRRKRFRASRDCILLAAAYLFGTLMAGILQALCDAEEMETLAYYLSCWRSAFAASAGRGVVWDGAGRRHRRSGGVPSAGAFCRRASAHLFICDAIWDRLRSALGTASDRPWRKAARFIPAYCQPADGSGGWGTLPLRCIRPTGQQPHPRLFLREGWRHSPYRRGTASGRTVCLADRLPLPALRRSHRACVPRKSSDAGRISCWFSCGSGPDVV